MFLRDFKKEMKFNLWTLIFNYSRKLVIECYVETDKLHIQSRTSPLNHGGIHSILGLSPYSWEILKKKWNSINLNLNIQLYIQLLITGHNQKLSNILNIWLYINNSTTIPATHTKIGVRTCGNIVRSFLGDLNIGLFSTLSKGISMGTFKNETGTRVVKLPP